MKRAIKAPMTRAQWVAYYGKRFDKTGNIDALVMGLWYHFLSLAFGEETV